MNGKKTRLFVDMDGTLAEWQEGTPLEEVCAPGYFAQLPPNENMAKAMIRFWEYSRKNNIEVFILSAVFDDGHSIRDKNAWLDQYIPFIDAEHRIFVSCEEPKTAYINEHLGGMSESDILIDDYSKNIKEWIAGGGKAIKMFNRVNGRSGAYFGPYTCSWLHPDMIVEDIKRYIQKFFSGMDYFYGDVEQAKKDYFKYMTWYLATPFMAYLRYFASRNNYDTKLFPLFGVMYGDSNGGKTTFIKFLVKLMCNETVKMNTTEDFTATKIDGLKRVCEGLPINIDDLAKTQFQSHSERIIKNDGWGVSERLINYPAVSITSNKITSLTKDLSKRAIICRIGAKIDNERGAKNSKRVNESMSELTTAFYGEYVRRMLVCIDEMTIEMRENANGKEYFPDIFYASSSVIADIFRACKIDLPVYAHILSYDDYMGDKSIGRAAIEKIELAWQADPNKFRVDKKKNRLIYSYPQDGPWYELKYIADELPNSLEAEISGGNQLVMNYEQAQELFGIKFRRWLGIFNL